MENITQALAVTVFGMIIVFAVLIILMLILNLMKLFAPTENAKQQEAEKMPEAKAASPKVISENEDELVAVLAAAVAASMNTAVSSFKIRSYKRLS